METSLATKEDLKDLGVALRHDMGELRHDMALLRQDVRQEIVMLEQKIVQSEQRMTIKLGTIVSIAIGAAVALTKMVS